MKSEEKMDQGEKLEKQRARVERLIRNFQSELKKDELRSKVLALIPIFQGLRSLGKALIPARLATAARERILYYFKKYPRTKIGGNELLVVSGIQEYARRVRELRVEFGWPIASGVTLKEMKEGGETLPEELAALKPEEYVLLDETQDRDGAYRWRLANSIRKERTAVRDKLLKFLRENIGKPITNEELRYVSGNKTEWARRIRELRTEQGWPVVTRTTGRPDLRVGVYILEADRQCPPHDRRIPDDVRGAVLKRDQHRCKDCGWTHADWTRSDPRHLEIHHIKPHAQGGENVPSNLKTLCTVCHDSVHRRENKERS